MPTIEELLDATRKQNKDFSELQQEAQKSTLQDQRSNSEADKTANKKMEQKGFNRGAANAEVTKEKMAIRSFDLYTKYINNPNYHLFDKVKKYTADEQIKDPDQKKLFQAYTNINKTLRALNSYGRNSLYVEEAHAPGEKAQYRNMLNGVKAFSTNKDDINFIWDANDGIKAVNDLISELATTEISDNDEFVQLWGDMESIGLELDDMGKGHLQVPKQNAPEPEKKPEPVYENGKQCHFISAKDPVIDLSEYGERAYGQNTKRYVSTGQPLFSHDPCPEDIYQGAVGDCYFVAALASIAASNPDAIKDMMRDNEDGTVTVRFYSAKGEPVYVTVNDTVPAISYTAGGKTVEEDIFAKSTHWVQIMEKAYVQSGLKLEDDNTTKDPDYYLKQAENGTFEASYQQISNGLSGNVFNTLLGNDPVQNRLQQKSEYINFTKYASKPILTGNYDATEKEKFDVIAKSVHGGKAVTCSTPHIAADNMYYETKGLPGGHEYSIIDVSEENGLKYIHVRNPHNKGGRVYENGYPKWLNDPTMGGVSKVELTDFMKSFKDVTITSYDMTALQKQNFRNGNELRDLYGESLKDICGIIDKSADFVGSKLVSSEAFNELRAKSALMQEELNKPNIDPAAFRSKMNDLIGSAEKYSTYRDTTPKSASKELKDRSVNRYYAAEMLKGLKEKIAENDRLPEGTEKKFVSTKELSENALKQKENNSPAREAMLKKIDERQQNGIVTSSKIRNKAINSMQGFFNKSYNEMSKALMKGDKDKFIKTMSQYCYVKSVQSDAMNLSDKLLVSKLDSKTIMKESASSESLLKDIFKNIPAEEIDQHILGANDPEKIVGTLFKLQQGHKLSPEEAKEVKWAEPYNGKKPEAAQRQQEAGMIQEGK